MQQSVGRHPVRDRVVRLFHVHLSSGLARGGSPVREGPHRAFLPPGSVRGRGEGSQQAAVPRPEPRGGHRHGPSVVGPTLRDPRDPEPGETARSRGRPILRILDDTSENLAKLLGEARQMVRDRPQFARVPAVQASPAGNLGKGLGPPFGARGPPGKGGRQRNPAVGGRPRPVRPAVLRGRDVPGAPPRFPSGAHVVRGDDRGGQPWSKVARGGRRGASIPPAELLPPACSSSLPVLRVLGGDGTGEGLGSVGQAGGGAGRGPGRRGRRCPTA